MPGARVLAVMKLNSIQLVAGMALAGVLAACVNAPPVNRAEQPPLATVSTVDLDRYGGLWHEAARFPNSFEMGCVAATARYTKRPDGLIGVRNECTKADGRTSSVDGRAKIVDATSNARLKVSFFGPFFVGDYWVLDLAPDYAWAIVGEPRGRFLWILTRDATISDALKTDLIARAAARGYRTEALTWNPR